ncbi:50S ribosomal protein L20 [Pendulispora albinea]|uniref:Large ribosomal subunit protein bL20 n=1 Tax=Pendulispora albinea TaxID=2741071 RepID=A0ABZ2LR46_9BACT
MPRAKRGFKARRRRNRILKHASGFHSARSRLFAYAKEVVMKAWVYAYAHRKRKKRDFRRLWIARINAAARTNGTSYSRLVHGLKTANVGLDRKVLSDLAITDAAVFQQIVELANKSVPAASNKSKSVSK